MSNTTDATKILVQLVPGYMKVDSSKGIMVPTYPTSWPNHPGASLAPVVPLASALSDSFHADEPNYRWYRDGRCFIMQCAPRRARGAGLHGPRLAGKPWEHGFPVTMVLLLTDVDALGKKEHGFDPLIWWAEQEAALAAFLLAHPGAFIACSRGGLRIYQVLFEPFVIDCDDRAKEWKARYTSWANHVRGFPWAGAAQGGADDLKDWTRLQRIPHDTRDGELQQWPTVGDPANVGLVSLPAPAKPDPVAFRSFAGPFVAAKVRRGLLKAVGEVLPKQGDGVHDCAFALGGIMSASRWGTEDCVQFVLHCFAEAGIQREDIARAAQSSVEGARAGGRAYGWRKFAMLCGNDWRVDRVCDLLRQEIPGLDDIHVP